ncbi:MAG: DUF58 domain-containing protein [Pirellulaceae bacterium]|nr:DUF58 domain-containing protein [Pirellulaceae bacterium]
MSTAIQQPGTPLDTPVVSKSERSDLLLTRLLNTDFCPQFNRYVYWLKEPVGWFALAATASLLVGAFLSPIGWTLAAGLIAMIVAGLALPWIAIRFTECTLEPVLSEINEHETSQLMLTVRNRLPLPLWGLMVEGYLASPVVQTGLIGDASLESDPTPDVGLACVPPLCNATFRLSIRPEYRGFYPVEAPVVACAFPFGIWTARRKIKHVTPVTVWPKRVDLSGLLDIGGAKNADEGVGERVGSSGDFLGVRAFRRGDSLRSIHWVQTARLDSLVVCDRTGPQRQTVSLELDTQPIEDGLLVNREHLAWRIRIVASLAELLCARHIPFQLVIDNDTHVLAMGKRGLKQALDLLAAIPLDQRIDPAEVRESITCHLSTRICVGLPQFGFGKSQARQVGLNVSQPSTGFRSHARQHTTNVDLNDELLVQLNHFLSEASHACFAA